MKVWWRDYKPGDVTADLPIGFARTMIDCGRAEPLKDDELQAKALDEPPMDRAMKRAKVRRK